MKRMGNLKTNTVEDLIFSLGIRPSNKGFQQLAYALRLALDDEDRLICVSRYLFAAITQQYGTSSNTINHNIKRIIEVCWYTPESREKLLLLAPAKPEKCPTVNEFLGLLYWGMKKQEREQGIRWV